MANTFTLAGTFKDAKNNPLYVGRYVVFRITSVGTDIEDAVAYPQDPISWLIDENGDFGGEMWLNGDSGVECLYEILEPSGQRLKVIVPSSDEGNTVRYEYILENYQAEVSTQQSTVLGEAKAYTDELAADPSSNGSFSASDWRADLDLEVGVDVQAWHTKLDDIASLTPTDGNFIVGNGTTWVAESGNTAQASLGLLNGVATEMGTTATASDTGNGSLALGAGSAATTASGAFSAAISAGGGTSAASGTGSYQIGPGTNSTGSSIQFLSSGSVTATEFGRLIGTSGALYYVGGTDVAVADGGTGASTAADARTNLGVSIGADVQAHNPILDTVETTITDTDTAVPTSGAVVDYVTASLSSSQVIVNQASDLSGTLDATKTYFIDGIIDMGSTSIEVPSGGLNLIGSTFDVSKLISSATTYTMFTSPVGGSGNLLGRDLAMEVTGSGSQVFNLVGDTGLEAFEFARVNWNDCTSLGTIDNYRQGLESGTGRFGGTPDLTLKGTWAGGYFIETSIVRSLDSGMTGALYQAGAGFTMASRFRSNQNIDLPASAAFIDFTTSNFTNPSTLQLEGCIVSRGGVFDSTDSNITPNVAAADLASNWVGNIGISNTFVGGRLTVTADTPTVINTIGVFETIIATTWTADLLEHFDDLAVDTNGRGLRHLGNVPRYYEISGDLVVDGPANDEVTVKVVKYDSSAASTVDIYSQTRQINSFTGSRDVAFFSIPTVFDLDQNDYVYLEISNSTTTGNLTLEGGSVLSVKKR